MLRCALLACLCLSARAAEDKQLPYSPRAILQRLPGPQFKYHLISPDTFEGQETYLVAEYNDPDFNQRPPKLFIKLTLINGSSEAKPKNCLLGFKGTSHTALHPQSIKLTSLRRVNENMVLLSWFHIGKDEVFPTSEVIEFDMSTCNGWVRHSDIMRLPIIVPTENKFIIFFKDLRKCQHKSAMCRWSYDLTNSTYVSWEIHHFVTEPRMDWFTLHVELLSNGFIKIAGLTMDDDRYMVFLLNPKNNKIQQVMDISCNNKKVDFISEGMSFCWIYPDDKTTVYCKQLNNQGKEIFRKIITFEQPKKLIDVRATREGELFLLTNNADCQGNDCWNMVATRIAGEYTKIERTPLAFKCTGDDQKQLTIFRAKNMDEYNRTDFHYGCKWDDKFHFNTFSLYRS